MLIVEEIDDIEKGLNEYHLKLAAFLLKKIKNHNSKNIVEIGSGDGTFTIPFLNSLNFEIEKFYCIDPYIGTYSGQNKILESKLTNNNNKDKVQIIQEDAANLDKIVSDIDLIIGHEVLCDLNLNQIEHVLKASYNALQKNGLFIHSDFSPIPINRAEEILQIIDVYSSEQTSGAKWFSPSADQLAATAHKIGFKSIRFRYKKIPIKFEQKAAIELIKKWNIKGEFLNIYKEEIYRNGIEFPMEQILFCYK